MKAIICESYGPPEVFQLKEVEKPVPNDSEILIKVYATTVNRTDCGILRAKPFIIRLSSGLFKPKHAILGTEFSGKIEAVGKKVSSFKIGDKVYGFDDYGVRAYAQYMTINEHKAVATMPKDITYEQAAASNEGAHYAYNFINKVELSKGQKVLVNGATGAIGSATVQLLKYLGVHITAVGNSKNVELVKILGANRVIDYEKEDFPRVRQKYDFIFDAVGKSSFAKCKPLLKPGGVYMSSELGYLAQNIFYALVSPIMRDKRVIFPFPKDCKRSLLFIKKLIEQGKFKTVIDRKYPLEKIIEAYKYVETGQKTGNVVITVVHDEK